MKKLTFLLYLFASLSGPVLYAQGGFVQLGTQYVADQGRRMIATSDGGYITVGSSGAKAVMVRTDCLGNIVATLEKAANPGPAVFWDVTELADGNLVAVGAATLAAASDTGSQVFLLKTTPLLVETASSSFSILSKEAVGKAIAHTPSGHLLVWGEVTGVSIDFTDAFFQRVSPSTLQPSAAPVVFNKGVDLASRILPTADGNYLLTGSSFAGNIFNPDAPIDNNLRAYKVDENGSQLWETSVNQVFLAKYGVAQAAGAGQNPETGNFMLGGTLYGGSDAMGQDAFFALISNDGVLLDTSFASALGRQTMWSIQAHHDYPGLFSMVGEGDGSPLGVPSIAFSQAIEAGNSILGSAASLDPATPIAIHDFTEIDPGRFAYMGTIPDNPIVLGSTDVVVVTPGATVGLVYQNCALAATLSSPALGFQWLLEGQPIPNANQGVYFPTEPGLYQVQVLDAKGCFGVSDTLRVAGPVAGFDFATTGLETDFVNTSTGATAFVWSFGDGMTSTQTNPSHTYADVGVYAVTLIAANNCGFRDTISYQVGVTATDDPDWLGYFNLAPNPTAGTFNVEMNGLPQDKIDFALFNAVGQLLESTTLGFQHGQLQKTFDLGPFPSGVYSLQIRSGKSMKNVRVLRQ